MVRLLLALLLLTGPVCAATVRVATYDTELGRDGPGLLLEDIRSGEDAQVAAVVAVIAAAQPDILVVQGVDYDRGGAALGALADRLAAAGAAYPYRFARRPNTGRASGLDLDGDGRRGGPGDAQGYGRFAGAGGMAVLSRYPIARAAAQDFSAFLWADLPGATLPRRDGEPFPSATAHAVWRLADTAHWDVPVTVGDGPPLRLLAFHATPPVFDGPEDRNGLRNRDEARFWRLYIAGRIAETDPPARRFIVVGDANLDPQDGDGRPGAMRALLRGPRLQDPAPASAGGPAAAAAQGGVNAAQTGDPSLDTADWADDGAGNLRVDYVLPSADLDVVDAGVLWPAPGGGQPDLATVEAASRHRLVWVDIRLPD